MKNREDLQQKYVSGRVIGVIILCFFTAIIFKAAAIAGTDELAVIQIKADSVEMLQEDTIPELKASIYLDGEGAPETVIEEKTNYKVQDLVNDLENGNGYTLEADTDGLTEGEYKVKVKISEEYQKKQLNEWLGKVVIKGKNGTITVKNKFGEWDGNKFIRTDGTYVINDWIISKGNTYYFGEDGIRVTGWQEIGGNRYFFNKEGIRQTGWYEADGVRSYLNDDGTMAIGWVESEGSKYYFNNDGKMLTGEQQIGTKKCTFSEDGKFIESVDNIDPTRPMLALTFDDGPGEGTIRILEELEKYGAHATFFMLGNKVPRYPEVIKKMKDIGCELGNHSMTHANLSKLGAGAIQNEIGGTNAELQAIVGVGATVVRPPYGATNDTVRANIGAPSIMWSIDTLDWKTRNTQATIDNVINTAKDGDIILMHDIHAPTVDAAIALIPKLINNGYQLVTVSELANARGIQMENGVSYSSFHLK